MSKRLPASLRRRQLLDVALLTFGRNGFHQTSMSDVAVAAGVTKPVLYQHFESKRHLFSEVLRDVGTALIEGLIEALNGVEDDQARVAAGFDAMCGYFDNNIEAFQVLFGDVARHDPDFAAQVELVEDLVSSEVARNITVAGLDQGGKELLAYGIVGLGEGSIRRWVHAGYPVPAPQLAEMLTRMAWRGLDGGIGAPSEVAPGVPHVAQGVTTDMAVDGPLAATGGV